MIYLFNTSKVSDTDVIIRSYHFEPSQLGKTNEELEKTGYLVDSLPDTPYYPIGYHAVLHINPNTRELWYTQEEIPTPFSDEIQNQKKQLAQALLANAQLAQDNALLKKQNADIMLRLAKNNIN